MISTRDAIQDPTIVTCIFHINGLYTSILFDSSVERRFITPKFSEHISHKSRNLDDPYTVEMDNRESDSTQEILKICLLTLKNYTFQAYLIHMIIGSFDVKICMDWLSPHQVEILYYDKAVQLLLPNGVSLSNLWR